MIFVVHVSVSAGLGLVGEKPFMTSFDCALCLSVLKINVKIKILLRGAEQVGSIVR